MDSLERGGERERGGDMQKWPQVGFEPGPLQLGLSLVIRAPALPTELSVRPSEQHLNKNHTFFSHCKPVKLFKMCRSKMCTWVNF